MQTFLPFPCFAQSAACLDRLRLGKQRVETVQILNALSGRTKGWVNHPATRMWRGFEPALTQYLRACIIEWEMRGFRNSIAMPEFVPPCDFNYPGWFGREDFHASHRSNLIRKNPDFYRTYGWTESPDLPYIWPVGTSS